MYSAFSTGSAFPRVPGRCWYVDATTATWDSLEWAAAEQAEYIILTSAVASGRLEFPVRLD
jgi:hypothetical protein